MAATPKPLRKEAKKEYRLIKSRQKQYEKVIKDTAPKSDLTKSKARLRSSKPTAMTHLKRAAKEGQFKK